MTAGRGITHSERFEKARAVGDTLHGIQAWVALPEVEEEKPVASRGAKHFSGSKENSSPMMETNKISVTSKHPLPGLAGLKLCHDPGARWTDRSDVEGMGQFLK